MQKLPFEFEGVVRVTKLGWMYLLFTLLIGFSALNTGNNALYIGLAFMLATLLLSGISSKSGMRSIELVLAPLEDAWAGREVTGKLTVKNRSRLFPLRDVIIVARELAAPVYVERLGRRSSATVHADFRFDKRGYSTVEHLDLYTRYPFALFLKKRRVRVAGTTLVFPRLVEVGEIDVRPAERRGDLASQQRVGIGPELFGLREYTKGDSVRQIHWKKSAALGRMVTIQSAAESSSIVKVIVDPMLPAGRTADDFEGMISRATSYIHDRLESGCEVVLVTPADSHVANATDGARRVYETLALMKPRLDGARVPEGTDGVLFSLRRAA